MGFHIAFHIKFYNDQLYYITIYWYLFIRHGSSPDHSETVHGTFNMLTFHFGPIEFKIAYILYCQNATFIPLKIASYIYNMYYSLQLLTPFKFKMADLKKCIFERLHLYNAETVHDTFHFG